MSLKTYVQEGPSVTWKDWLNAAGLFLTIATVMLQGGRMVERQEATNVKLTEATGQISEIRTQLAREQIEVAGLKGVDALHNEQIGNIRRDVETLKTKVR